MSDQLTLRDKLAVAALNGILSNARVDDADEEVMLCSANVAYAFADAMLAARKQPTAQVERLLAVNKELRERVKGLEALRPVWSNTIPGHVAAVALSDLWSLLGAKHQTEAMDKLKELLK